MSARVNVRPDLMHPVSVAAIGLLLTNDHLLKDLWPGALTGKLSDFAGLVFFPLLLAYLLGLVTGEPSRRMTVFAIVATGLFFSLIQVWDPAASLHRHASGILQFPIRLLVAGAKHPVPVTHTADPTDLVALPALLLAWWAGSALHQVPGLARRPIGHSKKGVA